MESEKEAWAVAASSELLLARTHRHSRQGRVSRKEPPDLLRAFFPSTHCPTDQRGPKSFVILLRSNEELLLQ